MERNRFNSTFLAYTERKLDVHKTFRRCPGRLLNVPAGNYMFEVNNRNVRPRSKVCSQLAIETYSKPCSTMAQVSEISKGPGTRIYFFGNILSMLHEE